MSVRRCAHRRDPRRQRPELWRLFNARTATDESVRVFHAPTGPSWTSGCTSLSARRFFHAWFDEFANLRMKFKTVCTLRSLLIPGWLTAEYLAGRRQSYLTPFKVYLICAALFFLSAPLAGFRLVSLIESDRSVTVADWLRRASQTTIGAGRCSTRASTCACDRCIRLHSALSPSCLRRCFSGSFADKAACTARI